METSKDPFVTELEPVKIPEGKLSVATFPNLSKLPDGQPAGMQKITIPAGHLLTPHLHPDSNETTICLGGSGKVGLIIPDTKKGPIGANLKESDFNEGDVVFLPQGYPHYFRNTGTEDMVLLLTFENYDYNIITLADILQQLPKDIIASAKDTVPNAQGEPVIKYEEAVVQYS